MVLEKKDNKKSLKSKKMVITVCVVVIVAVICVIVYSVRDSHKLENTLNVTTNTTDGYVEEIENGIKLNTSSKLNEAKEVGSYKISNIQLTTQNGITTLLADVTNMSTATTELNTVEITLLDEGGNALTSFKGVVDSLEPSATTKLNASTTSDYILAYDFEVTVN